MRSLIPIVLAGTALAAGPALAGSPPAVFAATAPLQVAHEDTAHDHDDEPLTAEEIRERRRELRRQERELRKEEREERREQARKSRRGRAWIGVGAGVGYASVDVPCQQNFFGSDCREEGITGTYSANITLSGPQTALRLRGVRDADKGDNARTPYETAALIGSRFGYSNWYGFAGYGRVRHPHDRYTEGNAEGFAWEIVFAPSSTGATGLELSFQGNNGHDLDYVAFNLGMRFGALR